MPDEISGSSTSTTGLSAFKGHPLAKASESGDGAANKLSKLDITDAEQLIAINAIPEVRSHLTEHLALTKRQFDSLVDAANNSVPPYVASTISTPRSPDLELGALEPTDEMLARMQAIPYTFDADAFAAITLPESVSWVDRMPAVRNQAGRGTCVAFAITAIHEFALSERGQPQDLSEQFLYYETKLVDGASNQCGTWQEKAAIALKERGQCPESAWPYNPLPPCNNHGALPANARAAALPFKLELQALNRTDIAGIKAALADRRLVGISIAVYNSWYLSAATRSTGRINMRIGNEPQAGGHAVCLVGYQDDASAPGGGYFILRNSWANWATDSPYGTGYGTIPYAYITTDNWEAFTPKAAPLGDVRVTAQPQTEFIGAGQECWVRFASFRVEKRPGAAPVAVSQLILRSWNGNQVVDTLTLRIPDGVVVDANASATPILLENLRLRANGTRSSWSYRVTWEFGLAPVQQVGADGTDQPATTQSSGELQDAGTNAPSPANDSQSIPRTIVIENGGVTITIR